MSRHLDFIDQMDHKSNAERFDLIIGKLEGLNTPYKIQEYSSGKNIIVDLGEGGKRTGVSSHFDKINTSGGANDNGAAISVCIDIIKRYNENEKKPLPLRIFFFDEEEDNLKGSTAYVAKHGTENLHGLINMELVGTGNQFAVWPVSLNKETPLLVNFELTAKNSATNVTRFDQIVTNSADHLPFLQRGLQDAFTITCISESDLQSASIYFQALAMGKPLNFLQEILLSAPTFAHYHRPSDTYDKLSEQSIKMTSSCIWESLCNIRTSLVKKM